MMRRLSWVALAVALCAVVAATMVYGQVPSRRAAGGQGAGRRAGGQQARARAAAGEFDSSRMQTMLQLLGLSEQEAAAALKTAEAKWKARQALEEERGKLRLAGDAPGSTEQQLSQAIAAYTRAMTTYRATVQSEDTALAAKLSTKSRARCLAAGILDNGLGFGGRSRTGGRSGERTGFGGRRGGGPAD